MKFFKALLVLGAACAAAVSAKPIRYDNFVVYRFKVETDAQAQILRDHIANHALELDDWSHGFRAGMNVDVSISPRSQLRVQSSLLDQIPHTVLISNLQDVIDAEAAHTAAHSAKLSASLATGSSVQLTAATVFSDYQDLSTLVTFFQGLSGATQFSIGTTGQGKDIPGFKIGTGSKSIVFHGGIHAREWISPAVVTYLANFLAGSDATAVTLRSLFTFHIMPVVNPDGYAYTRSTDRMHRKNMQSVGCSSNTGTDPNRNFNDHWSQAGASSSPCADDYYGTAAFSTQEAKAIANYVQSLGNVVSYIDFHSYSQLWMFPNGWSCSVKVKDYSSLMAGSQKAVDALQAVHGTSFTNGDICNTIYQASGSSADYMYNELGVTYAYAVELRDTGANGFTLPASQIVPSGEEVQAAVVALWTYVAQQLGLTGSTTTATTKVSTTTTKASTSTKPATSSTTSASTCAHAVCTTGVALKSSCSSCAAAVIAADSYCGTTSWDSVCVSEVATYCSGVTC